MLSSLSMGSPGACGSDWVVGGVFNSLLVFVCDLASFALCCFCVSYSRTKIGLWFWLLQASGSAKCECEQGVAGSDR